MLKTKPSHSRYKTETDGRIPIRVLDYYHNQKNNKHYIFLKTKGSDEKLIQYYKHATKKTFSINEKNIINTKIIRLKLKRTKILFEIEKDNNFCEIEL